MNALETATPRSPMARSPGRPSKFTRESIASVLRAIRKGWPLTLCCEASGFSYGSLRLYRSQSPKFDRQVRQAITTGISRRLKKIESASETDWRAAAWLLEHTQPEHFAKTRIELSGVYGAPLTGAIAVYLPRKDGDTNGSPVVNVNPAKELTNGND